jgi:CelD/BcsL family acetyltransferase involved in cellulose biosynthesis
MVVPEFSSQLGDQQGLRVRLLTTLADVALYEKSWDDLVSCCDAKSVFQDFATTMAHFELHLAESQARPHVVVILDRGEMIALAPMVWEPSGLRLGVLRWADSGTPLYPSLLCRPGHEERIFPLLSQAILSQPSLRKLKVDFVPDGSTLARFLASIGAKRCASMPAPRADLRSGCVNDRLSTGRKRKLRYEYRKLAAIGPVTYELKTEPTQIDSLVAWIFEFKRRQFAEVNNDHWIHRLQTERCFRAIARHHAAHGRAIGHQLLVGGQIAAASLTFRHGTTAFSSKIAYDPQFADGSPGWHEKLRLIEHLRNDGVEMLDLMISSTFLKERIASEMASVHHWRKTLNPLKAFLRRQKVHLTQAASSAGDR